MSVNNMVRDSVNILSMDAAMEHAAVASLSSTGPRSIGPDIKTRCQEEKKSSGKTRTRPDPVAEVANEIIGIVGIESIESCLASDASDIQANIVKRELAQECKRSVLGQLQKIKQRQQQQAAAHQRELPSARAKMQDTDKQLQQLAEELANVELERHQQEQTSLLRQSNHKLLQLTIEGVSRWHSRFCRKYEMVTKMLLKLDKETVQACAASVAEMRDLATLSEQLIAKIKNANNDEPELSSILTAERYCQNLDMLEQRLIQQLSERQQEQLNQAKQQAEEKEKQRQMEAEQLRQKKEEEHRQKEERRQLELEAQQKAAAQGAQEVAPSDAAVAPALAPGPATASTATAPAATSSGISSSYVHPTRLAFYNEINALYQSKVDAVKPLQTDESWKKYRTNCQRTINLPLNAITAASPQHLTTNFDKLYNFFAGQPVRTTDMGNITINDHPLARDYCILLMAKKFVSQTDTAISSNPQAAFPFASVINSFWKLLPEFGKIFLAYMYKESPYLVPYVIPQQPGQTPEQYLKTMGYRLSDSNELEKPDMFLKRQTGIARLYAAVIITPGRKADGPQQCFGLEEAWRWLTHIMLVKPLPDICATMIMEMLQTLGFELWRAYGQNFLKLLVYIQTTYIPQLAAYDNGGPKTRLEMLLSKFLRERQIPQAVGVLPPGFW